VSVASPVTDSCAVLTPTEISSVLGILIDPGKHTLANSDIMCNWAETGAAGAKVQRLVLNFSSLDAYNRGKNAKGNVKVTPAPGIGDDAIYVTSQLGTSLLIRKGNTLIGFSIRNMRLAADQEMAKEEALGLDAAARF
jgi:hypothetical protein